MNESTPLVSSNSIFSLAWRWIVMNMPSWFPSLAMVTLVLAIHFVKIAQIIPLRSLFIDQPLVAEGYSKIFADVSRARQFRKMGGRGWGYDPSEMAGVRFGLQNVDSNAPIAFDFLFGRWLGVGQTLRLSLFLALFLIPLLIGTAARGFGMDTPTALLAMAIAAAGFFNFDLFSSLNVVTGKALSLTGTHWGLLAVAALFRALQGHRRWYLLYFLSLGLTLLINPLACAVTFIPQAIVLWLRLRDLELRACFKNRRPGMFLAGTQVFPTVKPGPRPNGMPGRRSKRLLIHALRDGLLVSACVGGAVAMNFFWLAPAILNVDLATLNGWWNQRLLLVFAHFLPFNATIGEKVQACTRTAIFVAFAMGGWKILLHSKTKAFIFAAFLILTFLLGRHEMAVLGGVSVVLVIPAALGLASLLSFPVASLYLAAVVWFHLTAALAPGAGSLAMRTTYIGAEEAFIQHFNSFPEEGRVLVERNASNSAVLPLLPIFSDREFIGTSGEFTAKSASRPALLLHRQLSQYSHKDLIDTLRLYNVKYVSVSSLQARALFDRYPEDFHVVGKFQSQPRELDDRGGRGRFFSNENTYRDYFVVGYPSSFFIEGSGVITAEKNRLRIVNASAGKMILKYHWFKTLRSSSAAPLRPYFVTGDPTPFISLINNTAGATIDIWNEP